MVGMRRIVINILAVYGRSLYSIVIGLFASRWVLMALGESDYGLYGVVAGLTAFIALFNNLLSSSVARFFAYAIGQCGIRQNGGAVSECQAWFNTALLIHTIVPVALMSAGYPLGEWAVRNWLEIPPARIEAFVAVLRFACVSCFVGMVSIPFSAMYTAKQRMAELTLYAVSGNTCQAAFLYYIASHPSDWLVRYALCTCFIAIVPQLIVCVRALKVFPECKIDIRLCWDAERVRRLCRFACSLAFGGIGGILRGQGITILVNKYFGAPFNAAMSIANSVNGHAASLVAAMQSALTPAIVQACGAGKNDLMRTMAFRACKFGMLFVLLFAIPLGIEINNIMTLWLRTPPAYSSGLCLCMLALVAIDKSTVGHMIAVNANGKIAGYQLFLGTMLILTFPLAWLFVALGLGIYSVGIALVLMTAICSIGRVWFARNLAGMSSVYWFRHVLLPVMFVSCLAIFAGLVPRFAYAPSFGRLCVTTIAVEIVLLPLSWFFVLDGDERNYIAKYVRATVGGLHSKMPDEVRMCFDYDMKRFFANFGGHGDMTHTKMLSKIIKEYHVVEKCLTMHDKSIGRGKSAVLNLLESIKRYEELGYDRDDPQFTHAVGVLKAYAESDVCDSVLTEKLRRLCASYPCVSAARPLHYKRSEFYCKKECPFPEFAASRHTIRYFSPVGIDVNKIRSAVECACNSPSACNRQYVKVKAVFNREKIRQMLDMQAGSRGFGHLASVLLVVTVDIQDVGSVLERNDIFTNGGMFMMSLCYALHYQEIAHCILNWSKSPSEDAALRRVFPLPDSETIVAMIACGEPADEFDVAISPKKPVEQVLTVVK